MASLLLPLLFCSVAVFSAPVIDSIPVATKQRDTATSAVKDRLDDNSASNAVSAAVEIPTTVSEHPSAKNGYPKTGGHIFDILKKQVHRESDVSSLKSDWQKRLDGLHTEKLNAIKGDFQLPTFDAPATSLESVDKNKDLEANGKSIFSVLRQTMLKRGAEDNTGGTWQTPPRAASAASGMPDASIMKEGQQKAAQIIQSATSKQSSGKSVDADPMAAVHAAMPAAHAIQQASAQMFNPQAAPAAKLQHHSIQEASAQAFAKMMNSAQKGQSAHHYKRRHHF